MLKLSRIRAITLDLDDTLWPIWPTIDRAELLLQDWLRPRAPATAALFADVPQRHALREQVVAERPDIGHDLSALRLEIIRRALHRCDEDTQLAQGAFEVFFEARMKVNLYADALPALAQLAQRFAVVALTNGNADVNRVGLGAYFAASVAAVDVGVGKPDARIFHAAALAAGVACDEVLHIGDDPVLDVLGALGVGMQTVWVNRRDETWAHPQLPHLTVTTLDQVSALWVLR